MNGLPLQHKMGDSPCGSPIFARISFNIYSMPDKQNTSIQASARAGAANAHDASVRKGRANKINLHDFMEKNFRCDMSMSEFAKASGRSLSTFKRDFKQMSTLSPERWLTDRRLRAAYDLLDRGRRVSDVCFDVGFKNVSHFSAIFKRKFGKTPGEVRKSKRID